MRNKHILNELSAYIDGEAKHPKSIEAHLDECHQCRQRLQTLRDMRDNIRTLPLPERQPDFANNVLLRVQNIDREEVIEHKQSWLHSKPLRYLPLAACLLITFWAAFRFLPTTTTTSQIDLTNDEALAQEFSRLLGEGADLGVFTTSFAPANSDFPDMTGEEALALLAATAQEAYASNDPYAQAVADAVLESLTSEEYELLLTLLEAAPIEEE